MKGIFMIALLALAVVLRTNAQTPVDSTVVVQDTVGKVDTKTNTIDPQKKNNKHKGGKKNDKKTADQVVITVNDTASSERNSSIANEKGQNDEINEESGGFWQKILSFFTKPVQKDDCTECENQLAMELDENEVLREQVMDLTTKLEIVKTSVEKIDDKDFYRSLITTPLTKKYDSIQLDFYKKSTNFFDHETKNEMKWIYDVFYPLLDNYGKFTQDVAQIIKGVIKSFEKLAETGNVPNQEIEKDLFEKKLKDTDYFMNYRYMGVSSKKKDNPSRRIDYLEDVINDTRALFEDPSRFKKESFEEQLRRLK